MKLKNVRNIGRYRNKETGLSYNIKKANEKEGGWDVYYFLYRGTRHIMTDRNFHILFEKTAIRD